MNAIDVISLACSVTTGYFFGVTLARKEYLFAIWFGVVLVGSLFIPLIGHLR